MVKRTRQNNDPIGLYRYEENKIEVLPYFLYEVCIYKYWSWGCCLLGSKFYKADVLLKNKNKITRYKDYIIEKSISLVAAPENFIRENRLPIYERKKKKKK